MKKPKEPQPKLIRRFLPFIFNYWKRGLVIVITSLTTMGLGFAIPLLMAHLIDKVLLVGAKEQFVFVLVAFFIASQFPVVMFFIQGKINMLTNEYISRDIRLKLFEKMEHLPIKYLQKHPTGEFVAKLTNDVDQLSVLMFGSLIGVGVAFIRFFIASGLLLSMHTTMATMCLIIIPLYVVLVNKFKKPIDERYRDVMNQYDKTMANYQESLENLYLVKSYVLESYEKTKMGAIINGYITSLRRFINVFLTSQGISQALRSLNIIIVWGYGGYNVLQGNITVGALVAFYSISSMLFSTIDELSSTYLGVQKSKVSLGRIFEILDQKEEAYIVPGGIKDFIIRDGHIKFDNITFAYDEEKGNIFENLTLEIKPGEKIAFVGASGCGKSTLAKILTRFYECQSGDVFVDSTNIKEVDITTLRKQISEVQQSNFIMKGSIAENIYFGQGEIPLEKIIEASKIARAHDFINHLPQKYDEVISQNYANLSGGQLQRIAIARAIFKNKPILILDEATSALDPESEHLVLEALDDLMKGKTTIIISHHLDTLRKTDRIIVLGDKKIVEEGTFDELMEKQGRFYEIITQKADKKQNGEKEVELLDKHKVALLP